MLGLNVAADAAMTLAYTGVEGGMVIAVCDDPALHSSQNEQDTRFFAVHSKLPLLDAGNPQEAHDMAKEAFEISEKLHLPIILRLNHKGCPWKSKSKTWQLSRNSTAKPILTRTAQNGLWFPQTPFGSTVFWKAGWRRQRGSLKIQSSTSLKIMEAKSAS